ncbi:MAG: mitochondrial fission ELM1 family protein [Bdellovibrionales bacterium]
MNKNTKNSNKNTKATPSCWIITEGLKGTENQCIGIAEMLGLEPVIKTISLKQPWKSLSPYLGFEMKSTFIGDPIEEPYPDILITGGRKAIATSRYIKKRSPHTFTLHVMDPRIHPCNFNLVTAPEHDRVRGKNVIITKATPNRITVKTLQDGKKQFAELGKLPSPRIAVLIGGNSSAYTFDMETAKNLVHELKILQGTHLASLMITMSRRTPEEIQDFIRQSLKGNDNAYIWDGKGENPYFGFLAHADHIIATSDSTSMLSEACTTGKPTYMFPLKETGKLGRIKTLQNNLIKHSGVRIFNGTLDTWRYPPLNDSQLVANEVQNHVHRQWNEFYLPVLMR